MDRPEEPEEYELRFRYRGPGRGADDTVVVHRTSASGPGGHPVYTDDTGIVRAEISRHAEVRMIASGGHQSPLTPVEVRPVA